MIGQLLNGQYQVLQTLSNGGLGNTYIAVDTKIPGSPKCVIKHLQPASDALSILATARHLFECEAETLAKIGSHDQIPQTLAHFEEHQQFFLVQEFVDGQNLTHELTPGKRCTEAYIIGLLKDILPVLAFIHQQGVIHLDLKPENIIRRNDGKLVLIDFGAVKQVFSPWSVAYAQSTSVTVSIGTPAYMPTEQGRGKPRPQSDIYALGMICIQALTGLFPGQLQEDMHTGEMLWLQQAIVSPQLAHVLSQMVRYHFKDRYQSATEVLQALEYLSDITPIASEQNNSTNLVHELTLEWVEAGQLRTQTIRDRQRSKNPGTIRIGRNPQLCDIAIAEPTVSGLHVEIFFNAHQQSFYIRSLRQSNPPLVNGQRLGTEEVKLEQGSTLRLGRIKLRVSAIALREHLLSYTSGYALQQKIPPAYIQEPQPTPIPSLSPSGGHTNAMPLIMGVGVATVISAIGGLGLYKYVTISNSSESNALSTATIAGLNQPPSSVLTNKNQRPSPSANFDAETHLITARNIAASGHLLAAIAKAKEVSPASPVYKAATIAIATWDQQLQQTSRAQQVTQCQQAENYFQQGVIEQLAPEYIAVCQNLGIQVTASHAPDNTTNLQKQTTTTKVSWKCYRNGLNAEFLLAEGQYPDNDPLFAENHCQRN